MSGQQRLRRFQDGGSPLRTPPQRFAETAKLYSKSLNSALEQAVAPLHHTDMVQDLEIKSHPFSLTGNKKMLFSDDPARFLRFSDSGGILSDPVKRDSSFHHFCRNSEVFVIPTPPGEPSKSETSESLSPALLAAGLLNPLIATTAVAAAAHKTQGQLLGRTSFHAGETVIFSSPSAHEFLDLVLAWWNSDNVPCIWFPATSKGAELEVLQKLCETDEDGLLVHALYSKGFFPIRFRVENERLYIHVLNCPPAELPLSSVSFSMNGASFECRNRLLIKNRTFNGFTIQFPSEEIAGTYLTKVGLSPADFHAEAVAENKEALVGLIGQVQVEGLIAGCQIEQTVCDARIDDTTLTLFEKNTGTLMCAFNLESPALAIDGTAEQFVVSPDYSTALRITSHTKDFLNAVYQNRATQEAATRTAHQGPFIATNDDGFVRIENNSGIISISVNGSELSEISTNIAEPELSLSAGKPVVFVDDFSFQAELPSLEGIAATLKGLTVRPAVAENFQSAIARIIGLEWKYLTYCVFGKFAQAHLMIADALNVDETASLAFSSTTSTKETFLAIMAQFAGVLARECETILHYFPGFVLGHDKNILSSAGVLENLNLGNAENCYQGSLRTFGAITPHLYRIEGAVSRFGSVQKAATRDEGLAAFGALGISLAAAAFTHGFSLIGAAQQGVSLMNRESSKGSIVAETIEDAFAACSNEWDFIMQTLLPAVSSRFAQEIYPARLAMANIFLNAYADGDLAMKEKLSGLIAQRLGRLIAFCEFPSTASSKISRANCVDFLLKKQQHAQGIVEMPF